MPNNNNTSNKDILSKKIADEEGLKAEEIKTNISEQMQHPEAILPERVAERAGVNPSELHKDVAEQLGTEKNAVVPANKKRLWMFIGILFVIFFVGWCIF
jgi:hypothetical protein